MALLSNRRTAMNHHNEEEGHVDTGIASAHMAPIATKDGMVGQATA